MLPSTLWKVVDSLVGHRLSDIEHYAVLILNRPVEVSDNFMINLWNKACYRATADGGTDQWYQFVSKVKKSDLKQVHPDLVSGDFDSIRPETLKYCRDNGISVVETPDQDKTDFRKALEEILKNKKEVRNVMAVVENAGRLDHIMSNLNLLYEMRDIVDQRSVNLFLVNAGGITWLLRPGSHSIVIPDNLVKSRAKCGLIPLGAPCVVTTSGFKWDLNNDRMEFGELISTCNTYSETCPGIVTVKTDSPLLWTMSIPN